MANANEIMNWTFISETEVPNDVTDILIDG